MEELKKEIKQLFENAIEFKNNLWLILWDYSEEVTEDFISEIFDGIKEKVIEELQETNENDELEEREPSFPNL